MPESRPDEITLAEYHNTTKLKPIEGTGRDEPAYALYTESRMEEVTRKNSNGKPSCRVIISTSKLVRDGDVLESRGIELGNYRKNDVVLMCHNYRSTPIANSPMVKVQRGTKAGDDVLIGQPEFHLKTELSQEGWVMVSEGIMKAWSIGFIPLRIKRMSRKEMGLPEEREDEDGEIDLRRADYRILKSDLLEFSLVPVPADPGALTQAIRELHQGGRSVPCLEAVLRDAGFEIPELIAQPIRTSDDGDNAGDASATEVVVPVVDADAADQDDSQDRIEETEKFIHVPIRDKGQFIADSFKTISISRDKGISAVAGKLTKDGASGSMIIQKYLFAKADGWTITKAKAWVKKHKRAVEGVYTDLQKQDQDIDNYEIAFGEIDGCRWLFPMVAERAAEPDEQPAVISLEEAKKRFGLG